MDRGPDDSSGDKSNGICQEDKRSLTDSEKCETNEKGLPEPVVVIDEEAFVEKAPDGGWGWLIVVGSVIMHCLMGKLFV